jgi:hypothetical protein
MIEALAKVKYPSSRVSGIERLVFVCASTELTLPEDQRGTQLDFSTTAIDPAARESLVTAAQGDATRVDSTITDFGGPDPKVTQTPVLISDNAGRVGQTNLFTVTNDRGETRLVDTQGASYSDYTDYLRNNDLDDTWSIAHPASLTSANGEADPTS